MAGVGLVVHCAAETSGGKEEQKRNSIDATRNVLEAAKRAGVEQFIHISSLGVLKTSREVGGPLDERTPLDAGNLRAGPMFGARRSPSCLSSVWARSWVCG